MLQQYSRRDLRFQTLSQLKETYEEIGCSTKVADKRIKENWVKVILAHQSAQVEIVKPSFSYFHTIDGSYVMSLIGKNGIGASLALKYARNDHGEVELGETRYFVELIVSTYEYRFLACCDNLVIAKAWAEAYLWGNPLPSTTHAETEEAVVDPPIRCASCPLFKPFSDGTGRGLCCGVADTSLVVREHHKQAQDCLNLIEEQEQLFVEVESSAPTPKFEKQIVHTFYKQIGAWRITTDTTYFEKLVELNSLYPLGELVGGVHDSEQQFVAYVSVGKHQNIANAETAIDEHNTNDAALIPGYQECVDQGIQFKQRIGSETETVYWYAVANHCYNNPDRSYKTSCFEKLENAVKAAVDYLGKCGIDVAEMKQQLIDRKKASLKAENASTAVDQAPPVQSGSLTFKKAASATREKTVYEVFRALDSLGIVVRDENGGWYNSNSNDSITHATPYEAASALMQPNLSTIVADAVMPEIEVDSDIDADFGVLYRVWYSYHLLGTFYQDVSGKWIAQPCDTEDRPRCNTASEAQLIIVAMSGLLVADTADDVVELQDLPFDELTSAECTLVKQQALLAKISHSS